MSATITNVVVQVYNTLLIFVGIPGNILIMKVYFVKKPRSSSHVFIIGLALVDLLSILIRQISIVLMVPRFNLLKHSNEYLCRVPRFSNVTIIWCSVFLTTIIAFDRYFSVCRPHERKLTPFRAKLLVASSICLSLCISSPNIFSFGIVKLQSRNMTMCTRIGSKRLLISQMTLFYTALLVASTSVVILYRKVFKTLQNQKLRLRINFDHHSQVTRTSETVSANVVHMQIQTISSPPPIRPREAFVDTSSSWAPSIQTNQGSTMTTVNRHLQIHPVTSDVQMNQDVSTTSFRTVSQQQTWRGTRANHPAAAAAVANHSVQKRTSIMLLLVTSVFLISWTPPMVMSFIMLSRENAETNPVIRDIVYTVVLINHAINPVIYVVVNKRFRKDCIKVLRNIKWPWRRGNSS